jgi:ComF family protein
MKFLKKILAIIFPSHCLSCEKIISGEGVFCSHCWQKLQFITEPKCKICCHPFEFKVTDEMLCAPCLTNPPAYDKALTVFAYNQIIKKIIGKFKYNDATFTAKKLAPFLLNKVRHELNEIDLIVAVPLHKKRLRLRKFNQSLLLCRAMLQQVPTIKFPVCPVEIKFYPDFLLRIKNTKAQVELRRKQRKKNLNSAFAVNKKYFQSLAGKRILLVDDVITTGATLNNCAKVLKKMGAQKVIVLTVAKTVFR